MVRIGFVDRLIFIFFLVSSKILHSVLLYILYPSGLSDI